MLTGVCSSWVVWQGCFGRYTRLLMDASPELPSHFLKIYSLRQGMVLLSSLTPCGVSLSMSCLMCYAQLSLFSNRLHVSVSSGFPRGLCFLENPTLWLMRLTPAPGPPGEWPQGSFVPYHHSCSF